MRSRSAWLTGYRTLPPKVESPRLRTLRHLGPSDAPDPSRRPKRSQPGQRGAAARSLRIADRRRANDPPRLQRQCPRPGSTWRNPDSAARPPRSGCPSRSGTTPEDRGTRATRCSRHLGRRDARGHDTARRRARDRSGPAGRDVPDNRSRTSPARASVATYEQLWAIAVMLWLRSTA